MDAQFEAAVDAVVNGDIETLRRLLAANPDLVRARSARPHRATLLHYVGSNGVEDERQRTPKNVVNVARVLLDAGADLDAMADMYGGYDTFGLAATSCHPRDAGVLEPLLEFLLSRGATFDVRLINACHANGRPEAAQFLAARLGDDALDLEAAAGLGRLDRVRATFAAANDKQKRAAFAWACEYGHTDVALFLVDHGVPVDARVPPHDGTGLHWAAYEGHVDLVNALLSRGAPLDIRDKTFDGTPLEWARHGGHDEAVAALRRHQA
jgi:ankyrin repeat protein